jgi:hypothetical protein
MRLDSLSCFVEVKLRANQRLLKIRERNRFDCGQLNGALHNGDS